MATKALSTERAGSQSASTQDKDFHVDVPKDKTLGAAAGAVTGGVVAGPIGAVIGGVIGDLSVGRKEQVKKVASSASNTVKKKVVKVAPALKNPRKAAKKISGKLRKDAKNIKAKASKVTKEATRKGAKKAIALKKMVNTKRKSTPSSRRISMRVSKTKARR